MRMTLASLIPSVGKLDRIGIAARHRLRDDRRLETRAVDAKAVAGGHYGATEEQETYG
jgi:hypothetical protein